MIVLNQLCQLLCEQGPASMPGIMCLKVFQKQETFSQISQQQFLSDCSLSASTFHRILKKFGISTYAQFQGCVLNEINELKHFIPLFAFQKQDPFILQELAVKKALVFSGDALFRQVAQIYLPYFLLLHIPCAVLAYEPQSLQENMRKFNDPCLIVGSGTMNIDRLKEHTFFLHPNLHMDQIPEMDVFIGPDSAYQSLHSGKSLIIEQGTLSTMIEQFCHFFEVNLAFLYAQKQTV